MPTRELGRIGLRSLLLLLPVLGAALLGGCESVFFGALNFRSADGAVQVHPGVQFDAAHRLSLDVYRPLQAAPGRPLVVFFYGGRWEAGAREQFRFVGEALAARGITTLIPDYRVYPQVKFDAIISDAATSAAWAFDHAQELGADPRHIYLAGHSAGAHLAALLATDARHLAAVGHAPKELAGVIGVAGPYDFLPLTDDDLKDLFGPPENYPSTQPINFVDGDEPPFLLLHGTGDLTVKKRNSVNLAARLEAAHESVELKLYPGVGHVRILASMSAHHSGLAPTLDDIAAFVGRTATSAAVVPDANH